jgi:hypothetical protein
MRFEVASPARPMSRPFQWSMGQASVVEYLDQTTVESELLHFLLYQH